MKRGAVRIPADFEIRRLGFIAIVFAAAWFSGPPCARAATHPAVTFAEIAQSADLIVVGTVDSAVSRWDETRTLIVTDVVLREVQTIHATARAVQAGRDRVTLTRVGGVVGETHMQVSDQPRLEPGHRYLLCLLDRGDAVFDPIIGGDRGVLEIVREEGTGLERVYGHDGRAIAAADERGLALGARVVRSASRSSAMPSVDRGVTEMSAPLSSDPDLGVSPVAAEADLRPAMTLAAFRDFVRLTALRQALPAPALRWQGLGSLFEVDAGGAVRERALASPPPPSPPGSRFEVEPADAVGATVPPAGSAAASLNQAQAACGGGPMGACGYFSLPIVMEQAPTTSLAWHDQNNAMAYYNLFMDLYRTRVSDGTVGHDGQNEFCGWISEADLRRIWGYGWGGALAMTFTTRVGGDCGRNVEADILYNPAYDWTTSRDVARSDPSVILLLPATIHELGHVWGNQSGIFDETYDYDYPSVMHGYSSQVEEDGNGLHAVDAYLIRRQYQSQRSILPIRDVGVESYYACGGLHSATISGSAFRWLDAITFSGVTVENMSYAAIPNVRLRFYLSTDRILDAGDQPIGDYWSWPSADPEAIYTADYHTRIPEGTRGGQYYVLASVTINGDAQDDFRGNNVTSFADPITVLNPAPQIASVEPGFVEAEGSQSVTIRGAGFAAGVTTLEISPGLGGSSFRIDNSTSMTVTLAGLDAAALGPRAITVRNPGPGGGPATAAPAFALGITIYPGDANADGHVEARDILPIGRFFGATGAARPSVATAWGPQRLLARWGSDATPHADCNGDGAVNEGDVAAIVQNWGATRGAGPPAQSRDAIVAQLVATLDAMPQDDVTRRLQSAVRSLSTPEREAGEGAWLAPAAPNPFRELTVLSFELPKDAGHGRIEIFDVQGHLVWRRDLERQRGPMEITWDGRSHRGAPVAAGQYFVRVSAPGFVASRRLLRLP